MLNQIDVLVHFEHYKDLIREVEQERLARLALSSQPKLSASFTPFAFFKWLAKFAVSTQSANELEKKTKIQKNIQIVEVACCNPSETACCVA